MVGALAAPTDLPSNKVYGTFAQAREEINYIHRILDHGTGADRQLRIFHETGDLTKVVDYIAYETEAGLTAEPVTASAAQ